MKNKQYVDFSAKNYALTHKKKVAIGRLRSSRNSFMLFITLITLISFVSLGVWTRDVKVRNSYESSTWIMTYGGTSTEGANSVRETSDGGYIVAGETWSFKGGGNYGDAWVLKLDQRGEVEWEKSYGQGSADCAMEIMQTAGDGFLLACQTWMATTGHDYWILKLGPTGEVSWQRAFGGIGNDYAQSALQTSDGGFIICGNSCIPPGIYGDAWLIKLDVQGNVEWQRELGGTSDTTAGTDCIQQTRDGGYITAGRTSTMGLGSMDPTVFKLDQSGVIIWQKSYGAAVSSDRWSIVQTEDGGYLLAGGVIPVGATAGSDIWIFRLDGSGNTLWWKSYAGGANESINSVHSRREGGFILCGYTSSFGAGDADILFMAIDEVGQVLWQKTYGGSGSDMAYCARQTNDGGYIAVGGSNSFTAGDSDIVVLRIDGAGEVADPCGLTDDSFLQTSQLLPLEKVAAAQAFDTASILTIPAVSGKDSEAVVRSWCGPTVCEMACFASANPSSGQMLFIVAFKADVQVHNCGDQMSYRWDFGDGQISMEQNPTHVYTREGVFIWSLTAIVGAQTCTQTGIITVNTLCSISCSASASPPTGNSPLLVSFTAEATPSEVCTGAPSFSWSFGDGGTSAEQNPTHTYSGAGTYTWAFTASVSGQTCTRSGEVTVILIPGDCDGNGRVNIGEVQKAVNMFLGSEPPGCGADCDGSGRVSIGELQKVINAFLGETSSC